MLKIQITWLLLVVAFLKKLYQQHLVQNKTICGTPMIQIIHIIYKPVTIK